MSRLERFRSRRRARPACVALVGAGLLAESSAQAQCHTYSDTGSTTSGPATLKLSKPTAGRHAPGRPSTGKGSVDYQMSLNYQDCLQNVPLTWRLSGTAENGLEIWASESIDCSQSLARETGRGCTRLTPSFPSRGVVTITAQQIAAALPDVNGCIDVSSSSAPHHVKLFFMSFNGSDPATNCVLWTRTEVDLLGPHPPSGSDLSLGIGDTMLFVNLPRSPNADTAGYYIFCDPNPTGGSTDAGIGGLDPIHPSPDSPQMCQGPIARSESSSVISGLVDGQSYVLAVAGYDELNNIGPLSALQSATPEPTDTFFNVYCADHGPGCHGCTRCHVGTEPAPTWPTLAGVALLGVGILGRRSRARGRDTESRR